MFNLQVFLRLPRLGMCKNRNLKNSSRKVFPKEENQMVLKTIVVCKCVVHRKK